MRSRDDRATTGRDGGALALDGYTRRRMAAEAESAAAEAVAAAAAERAATAIAAATRATDAAEAAADAAARAVRDAASAAAAEQRVAVEVRRNGPSRNRTVDGSSRLGGAGAVAALGARLDRLRTVGGEAPSAGTRAAGPAAAGPAATGHAAGHAAARHVAAGPAAAGPAPAEVPAAEHPAPEDFAPEEPGAEDRAPEVPAAAPVAEDPVTDEIVVRSGRPQPAAGTEPHRRRAARPSSAQRFTWARRFTARPTPVAAAAAGVLVVMAVLGLVAVVGGDDAAPTAVVAADAPPSPAAPPPEPVPDDKPGAYLEALRAADIPASRSGRVETEAADAICAQLDEGVDRAEVVRTLPAMLAAVSPTRLEQVVDLAERLYC